MKNAELVVMSFQTQKHYENIKKNVSDLSFVIKWCEAIFWKSCLYTSFSNQNVIINYQDKEITSENFDIDMETNIAIAYNNVIVTDPKSTMKGKIIIFDLKTKDININPKNSEEKVKVITN